VAVQQIMIVEMIRCATCVETGLAQLEETVKIIATPTKIVTQLGVIPVLITPVWFLAKNVVCETAIVEAHVINVCKESAKSRDAVLNVPILGIARIVIATNV